MEMFYSLNLNKISLTLELFIYLFIYLFILFLTHLSRI